MSEAVNNSASRGEQIPLARSAATAAELIRRFLAEHQEVKGIRALARASGISYDALQKYARGTSTPPKANWDRLVALTSGLELPTSSERRTLFEAPLPAPARDGSAPASESRSAPASTGVERPNQTDPEDRQEFFLPVHGFVWLYPEEVEIVDHPAFQRLSSMQQLGLASIVYRGATHRRIEHVLGTVWVAHRILSALANNCRKQHKTRHRDADPKVQWLLGTGPTAIERRFVRLAALLHDIGHVPYGHTIEDELGLLDRHDGPARLEAVTSKGDWHQTRTETLASRVNRLYGRFVPPPIRGKLSPIEVVKAIVQHGYDEEDNPPDTYDALARQGLRLQVCRDIVGNTICADLLDYLHRDWYHIGKPKHLDERIFHYMEIRSPKQNSALVAGEPPPPTAQDRFVISIGSRPRMRTDGVSAILNLLECRYELAEAVLFHRTKMAATAMLERTLSLALPGVSLGTSSSSQREAQARLEAWLLEHSEEELLPALMQKGSLLVDSVDADAARGVRSLASGILRRDLYHQLLVVTYDELEGRDAQNIQELYANPVASDRLAPASNRQAALLLLEQEFAIPVGSLAMYCPESRMNSKIAETRLFVEGRVDRFADYERAHDSELSAGHLDAQLRRFKRLWRVCFYCDSSVWNRGEEFLAGLRAALRTVVLQLHPREETITGAVLKLAQQLVRIEAFPLYRKAVLAEPRGLQVARAGRPALRQTYPGGAPTINRCIDAD